MSDRNKGIVLLLLSSLGFSLMAMFVKLSGEVPTTQKTLFRNAVSMVIAFGFVIYFKAPIFGKKKNQKYLLLRSALGGGGNFIKLLCNRSARFVGRRHAQ